MEKILFILSLIGGWFSFLIGEWHISLTILILFLIIGGITAMIKSVITKNINSHNAYKVIIKKFGIIIAVVLANLVDILTGYDLLFRSMTILFFIGLIGVEIVENLGHMGVPIPQQLTKYLSQLTNEEDPNIERKKNNNE